MVQHCAGPAASFSVAAMELELAAHVVLVFGKVLSHVNSFLDQIVEVLWDLRSTSYLLEKPK